MPDAPTRRLPGALLAWLGIVLGLGVLWGIAVPAALEAGAGGAPWSSWDYRSYFLPKFVLGSREVFAGRLPLWNPYESMGLPLLGAAQPASLYPPMLLAYLLPAQVATPLYLVGHALLLGGGFLAFARGRGIGALGAFAGAAFLIFGVTLLTSHYHPNRIACLAWVPWAFALADRIAAGSRPAWAALACVIGAMLLAGYPVFVSDTGILLAVVAAASWACGAWTLPPHRAWLLLGAAFAAGAGLAAPQILAAAQTLSESGRAGMADQHAEIFENAVSAGALLPMLIGVPALLALGLGGAGRRESWPPLAGWLFALAMLVGGWKLLRLVPGLAVVRHPLSWTFAAQLPLAWWVAAGIDALAHPRSERDRTRARAVLALAALGWGGFCALHAWGPGTLWPEPQPLRASVHLAAGPVGALGWAGACGLAAAVAWGIAAVSDAPRRRAALGVAIAAAVLGQIAAFPFGVEQDVFDRPDHPLRTRNLGLGSDVLDGRILSIPDAAFGFSPRDRIENLMGVEASVMPPRFRALQEELKIDVFSSRVAWMRLAGMPGLLDALDVSALLVPRRVAMSFARGWRRTGAGTESHRVLVNERRPGRAWVVYGVSPSTGLAESIARIVAPDFDPRRQVVLESPTRGTYPLLSDDPPTPASVRYPAPTRTEITVRLPRPGVLVLADACHSGWRVTVDGRPASWQCANAVARAVELDAGEHRVEFRFATGTVRIGFAVAAGTLLALLAVSLWRRRSGETA